MHIAKFLQWFMLIPSHSYWIGRKKEIKREQSICSHVGACHWLTNFVDRSSGKTMELGGLHHNWKQRAQVPSQHQPLPLTITLFLTKSHSNCWDQTSNPASDGDDPVEGWGESEIGADENIKILEAVQKSKQAIGVAKKSCKGGTKGVSQDYSLKNFCSKLCRWALSWRQQTYLL